MKVWGFQTGAEVKLVANMDATSYKVFLEVKPDDNTTGSVIKAAKSLIGTINSNTTRQLCSGRLSPVKMNLFCIVDDNVIMNDASNVFFDYVKIGSDMIIDINLWVPSIDGNYYMVDDAGEIREDIKVSRKLIESYRILFQTQKK